MSDTHINAYYGAVDEAKTEVTAAKGKLAQAEEALKAHPDYEEPKKAKKEDTPEVAPPEPSTADAPKRDNKGHFVPATPSK